MEPIKFGILTVSDTCWWGEKPDTSGPALTKAVRDAIPNGHVVRQGVVPDEAAAISGTLVEWSEKCDVVLTTGGTGLSPRDVTPEATRAVIDREVPGVAYAIVAMGVRSTPMAMLTRLVCGVRGRTVILNLPGSARASVECFGFVKEVIPHAVDLVLDRKQAVAAVHVASTPSRVKLDAASRIRESDYEMVEVDAALDMIKKECPRALKSEELPIEKCLTRVLAEDVKAETPVPPFRASIKDGYAVLAADGVGERTVVEVAAAGDQPEAVVLNPGEAVRISTGAPVPGNADAVVQVEDTEFVAASEDGREQTVRIKVAPNFGQDIREIGSDIAVGETVLKRHDHITPYHAGVLATLGRTTVKVYKRASVGIISTGNELVDVKVKPKPGQIRDSNKITLMGILKHYGYESDDCGVAKDDPDSIKSVLERAFSKHDVIVTSGGVSMGEFDLVKQVLVQDFGAIIHFGRLNMKPGKPTVFATLQYGDQVKSVFSLPGNPVSCSVTCLLFVVPTLRYAERRYQCEFPVVSIGPDYIDGIKFQQRDTRPEYVRVKVEREHNCNWLCAKSTGNQISSRLNSMVGANGLLRVPGQTEGMPQYWPVMLVDNIE